jgi:hypothetical protein
MVEEWRKVKGFEDYQVSNLGRVKSFKWNKERILKGSIDRVGYLCVCLNNNSKRSTKKIHKLVAIVFLKHLPCGYNIIVDHIDNDPLNNKLDNLQLINSRENTSKDRKGGTSKYVGVSWHKPNSKWASKIRIEGKSKHLGYFKYELEASNAYQNKLKEINHN